MTQETVPLTTFNTLTYNGIPIVTDLFMPKSWVAGWNASNNIWTFLNIETGETRTGGYYQVIDRILKEQDAND